MKRRDLGWRLKTGHARWPQHVWFDTWTGTIRPRSPDPHRSLLMPRSVASWIIRHDRVNLLLREKQRNDGD